MGTSLVLLCWDRTGRTRAEGHGKDCDKDEREDSGLAWSGGREGSRISSIQLLVRLGRAAVRGLALDDGARAFEYKVPFGVMDTAQSWPFVVFKQIMIPTFQTI